MNTIYTYGYSNSQPGALADYAARHGMMVVDTRLRPVSRYYVWNKRALENRMGDHYRHVGALGNLNYKTGGEIILADPAKGVQEVITLLERQPVILLCACRDVAACHRKVVAELIAAQTGAPIVHLTIAYVAGEGSE